MTASSDGVSITHDRRALIATVALIILAAIWHARHLAFGDLSQYDEFYTFDRTLGFARHGDWWSVYSLGHPSLVKPPLQYWMSAGLIEAGLDPLLALRLPSFVMGILALGATAALAAVLFPMQPLVMPVAVAFLATSEDFWRLATSAMLDSGAALFSTLGIAAIAMTLRDLRWWPLVVAASFLAGFHKSPVPAAFLVLAVIGVLASWRRQPEALRRAILGGRIIAVLAAALVAGFAWTIMQEIRYADGPQLGGSPDSEIVARFLPALRLSVAEGFRQFDYLILGGEPVVRVIGILSLVILPFTTRRPILFAMAGIIILYIAAMLLAVSNTAGAGVSPRYTMTVLPLLSVGAAAGILVLMRRPSRGLVAAAVIVLALGGPFRPIGDLDLEARYGVPMGEVLGPLAATFTPGETLVLCRGPRRIPPGAIGVYAPAVADGYPIYVRAAGDLRRRVDRGDYGGGPVRGICQAETFEADFADAFEGVELTDLPAGYVLFSARALR